MTITMGIMRILYITNGRYKYKLIIYLTHHCNQETLISITRILPEEDMHPIDISRVESNGMTGLSAHILKRQEVVGQLGRAGHFTGSLKA